MNLPDYFCDIPVLTLHDPLAAMLGVTEGGVLQYCFEDVVKLTGHACPTVAGAWTMARRGLACLYPSSLPQRGGIRVELRGAQEEGTHGVVGAVLGFITGAAGEGGFKGLGGQQVRRGLLSYGASIDGTVRLTRLDTGDAFLLDYYPETVAPSPEIPGLLARVLGGMSSVEEQARFAKHWQNRLQRILVDHAEDPVLVTCRKA